jgi:hypothetical protein
MPKVTCTQSFSSGDGMAYESGVEYDVPAATVKANPDYFKQSGTAENKMEDTTEDKSADEATEEVTEETG